MRPTLHLTAAVTRDADGFLARCLEVDDLAAHGASMHAALRALTELAAQELGELRPPYPPRAIVVPLEVPRSPSPLARMAALPTSGPSLKRRDT